MRGNVNEVRCSIIFGGDAGHIKPVCLSLFLSQSAFVTPWERAHTRVEGRKYNHVPFAILLALSLYPCSTQTVAVRDGSLTGNQRQLLFNAMSRDWTASDGGTRRGPLCSVHRPITADETLPTEQLVRQRASCKCNDCQMWVVPVRTAININRHLWKIY